MILNSGNVKIPKFCILQWKIHIKCLNLKIIKYIRFKIHKNSAIIIYLRFTILFSRNLKIFFPLKDSLFSLQILDEGTNLFLHFQKKKDVVYLMRDIDKNVPVLAIIQD